VVVCEMGGSEILARGTSIAYGEKTGRLRTRKNRRGNQPGTV